MKPILRTVADNICFEKGGVVGGGFSAAAKSPVVDDPGPGTLLSHVLNHSTVTERIIVGKYYRLTFEIETKRRVCRCKQQGWHRNRTSDVGAVTLALCHRVEMEVKIRKIACQESAWEAEDGGKPLVSPAATRLTPSHSWRWSLVNQVKFVSLPLTVEYRATRRPSTSLPSPSGLGGVGAFLVTGVKLPVARSMPFATYATTCTTTLVTSPH